MGTVIAFNLESTKGMSNIVWNLYRADLQFESDFVAYGSIGDVAGREGELT